MDKDLFNRIVDFLVPYMGDPDSRKALIESALRNCAVLNGIDWRDDALTFTRRLVDQLDRYGTCQGDTDPSLIVLLRAVGGGHGTDVADEAHDLIRALYREISDLAVGVQIGNFELVRRLGQGGNGDVWLAQNPLTGREVAIKILLPDVSRDSERVNRFFDEMRTASQLNHPHIVHTIDAGEWRGQAYLVMQYIPGGTLRERINDGDTNIHDSIRWLQQLAAALDHVHTEHDIVHRDVKPENILVSADGQNVYLTDFGLALNLKADTRHTAPKEIVGTGRYMAPEQWLGEDPAPRTDQYALSIMAYELLTGERPFAEFESRQADYRLSNAHVEKPIKPHPRLAPRLWRIIRQAAAKKADDRFESARAFVGELSQWLPRTLETAPQIIISYARNERRLATNVAHMLARWGYQPWLDMDGAHHSEAWDGALSRVMDEAVAVVALLTYEAWHEPTAWVRKEVEVAREHETPCVGLMFSASLDSDAVCQELELDADTVLDFTGDRAEVEQRLADLLGTHALPADNPALIQPVEAGHKAPFIAPVTPNTLHEAYLRRWFSEYWATVSLADFTDQKGSVSLLDIYVPLRVDFALTVKVADRKIVDWWVKQDRAEDELQRHEPDLPEARRVREWTSLGVGEADLQLIIEGIQEKLDQREDVEDGEHNWYMEAHDAASVQPRFVLVGDPGSGKSSFVRHLALCLAGESLRAAGADDVPDKASLAALRDWLLGAYTPVYIELRHLVQEVFAPLPSDDDEQPPLPTLADFWRYVQDRILGAELSAYVPQLQVAVEGGEAIILLDGLDEVDQAADPRRRDQVQALVSALGVYDRTRIIVTSRPYAYKLGGWSLAGFGRAELEPLSFDRLQELAQMLFAQLLGDGAEAEVEAFGEALRDVPADLRSNPLYFTMLSGIWLRSPGQDRSLPTTRGALYRQGVDHLLTKWTRRRGFSYATTDLLGVSLRDQLRVALEMLACEVHGMSDPGSDTTEFRRRLLSGYIAEAIRDELPDTIIQYLEQRAGILVSGRPGHFRFVHRSFQEHLAACELTLPLNGGRPPAEPENAFPEGIVQRVEEAVDLWLNVARLAVDELISGDRKADLLALLAGMISTSDRASLLALQVAREHGYVARLAEEASPGAVREVCQRIMVDTAFTPIERAEVGRMLAEIDDPRPGVGVTVREDGLKLPDIEWVEIPNDGEWTYQKDKHPGLPAFRIARYPVTYAQFQCFVDAPDYNDDRWWDDMPEEEDAYGTTYRTRELSEQRFKYANHPRERVAWYQAVAFCRWLSDKLGYEVTLPTEEQWEKAARGADGREYPYEGAFDAAKGNTRETGIRQTSAVGLFPAGASPYGVLDMSGNVWEWCLNKYDTPDDVAVDVSGARRVLRGGSWSSVVNDARAVYRFKRQPSEP